MADRNEQGSQPANPSAEKTDFSVDEESISKHNQFQMFPTPDQKQASEAIKKLDVL